MSFIGKVFDYANKRKIARSAAKYEKAKAALSPRALKLLERIEQGEWYSLAGNESRIPTAMEELWDAGLIQVGSRVKAIEAAFVPVRGWKPGRMDTFQSDRG